ncbi:MAG: hypothetical protein RL595_2212 [Planctomycetota bacterium]|jgi:cyclic pyranopterin phosphate synthase
MAQLSHFDDQGASRMVDTSAKEVTLREARASGLVHMATETAQLIQNRQLSKGDVIEVARLAGIQAAKKTWDLIPLCHPLALTSVKLNFDFIGHEMLKIEALVKVHARTGVEMEALCAVSVAALTVFDMCKAVDKGITITEIKLEEKLGGKSGHFVRNTPSA